MRPRRSSGASGLAGVFGFVWATACAGGPGVGASASAGSTTTTATTSGEGMTSTTAVTSTSTTSGASGSPTESDPCGFVCPPDVPDRGCDIWAQECPEGEKCNPYAADGGGVWDGAKCFPVDPRPDGPGEPCTAEESGVSGIDSCAEGSMCWNVDPEALIGVCVALCVGSESVCTIDPFGCCPFGSACSISAHAIVNLCLPACHPQIQDCESPGDGCYPVGDEFECVKDASGEDGLPGDPCEHINACDPGTYCGDPTTYPGCDPNADGCCIPFCDLDAPECVGGTECSPWYAGELMPPWYEDLGACVIP